MRSRKVITRVIVFLLLGAVVNVVVAWGFLNIVPIWDAGMFGPDTTNAEQEAWWSKRRPAVAIFDPGGLSIGFNRGALKEHIYPFDESPNCVTVIRSSAGWPTHSVIGGLWRTNAGHHVASTTMMRLSDPFVLPIGPIWPGFAINTLFYAAILWLFFAVPFALRRRRRIRRGLCPACAYPVGDNAVCTECGTLVDRAR